MADDMLSLERFETETKRLASERLDIAGRLDGNIESAGKARKLSMPSKLASLNPLSAKELMDAIDTHLDTGANEAALEAIDSELNKLSGQLGEHVGAQRKILGELRMSVAAEIQIGKTGVVSMIPQNVTTALKTVRSTVAATRSTAIQRVTTLRNVIDQRIGDIAELKKARIDLLNEHLTRHVGEERAFEIVRDLQLDPTKALKVNKNAAPIVEQIRDNITRAKDLNQALSSEVEAVGQIAKEAKLLGINNAGKLVSLEIALADAVQSARTNLDTVVRTYSAEKAPIRAVSQAAHEAAHATRSKTSAAATALREATTKFEASAGELKTKLVKAGKAKATLHAKLIGIEGIGPERAETLMKGIFTHNNSLEALGDLPENAKPIVTQLLEQRTTLNTLNGEVTALRNAAPAGLDAAKAASIVDNAIHAADGAVQGFTTSEISKATAAAKKLSEKLAKVGPATAKLTDTLKARASMIGDIEKSIAALPDAAKTAEQTAFANLKDINFRNPKEGKRLVDAITRLEGLTDTAGAPELVAKLKLLQQNIAAEVDATTILKGALSAEDFTRIVGDGSLRSGEAFRTAQNAIDDGIRAAREAARLGEHLDHIFDTHPRFELAKGRYDNAMSALKGDTLEKWNTLAREIPETADCKGMERQQQIWERFKNEHKFSFGKGPVKAAYQAFSEAHVLEEQLNRAETAIRSIHGDTTEVNGLIQKAGDLGKTVGSEHIGREHIGAVRTELKAIKDVASATDAVDGMHTRTTGVISSALERIKAQSESAADALKGAGKIGTKGWMVVGAAGVIGAITAVLAFGDKPRQTHAERIRQQSLVDPTAMGLN